MGLRDFDDVGKVGFDSGWRDVHKDLLITWPPGEVLEIRFLPFFLPIQIAWVPFYSKRQKRYTFFSHMDCRWDLAASDYDDNARDPADELGIFYSEAGVFLVLLVDKLLEGDFDNAFKVQEWGSRERTKIDNQSKFNVQNGGPQRVGHAQYGKTLLVSCDPNAKDKANKWTFNVGKKLPIQLNKEQTKVRIKVPGHGFVTLDVPDLLDIVFPMPYDEAVRKFSRMKVAEAVQHLAREKEKKDRDDDDRDDHRDSRDRDDRGGRSPRREGRGKREPASWEDEKDDGNWEGSEGEGAAGWDEGSEGSEGWEDEPEPTPPKRQRTADKPRGQRPAGKQQRRPRPR